MNKSEMNEWTVFSYQPAIVASWEPLSEIAVFNGFWYDCGMRTRKILPGETFDPNYVRPISIQRNWQNLAELKSFIGKPYYGILSWNWGKIPTNKAIISIDINGKISRIRTYSGMNWNAQGYGSPVCDTDR